MKKRSLSLLTAISILISCSPLYANAVTSGSFAPDIFNDCICLEDDWSAMFIGKYEAVYMKPNENHGASFYFVESYPDMITFSVSKDFDEAFFEQIINEIDYGLVLQYQKNAADCNCIVTLKNDEGQYAPIGSKTAKELYKKLSEYVTAFDYKYDRYMYNYGVYEYLTGYEEMDYSFSIEERLNEYLESNDINASLVKYSAGDTVLSGKQADCDKLYVVPENDITIMQHYELAKSIAEETGIRPHGVSPTGLGGNTKEKNIDFEYYLDGDSNCDGIVELADAIFIMQFLANPDKYQISVQGRFNGDTDNNGITSGDALAIQEYLLGLR
ncbi:dockerin type I repeat-containing protein [uncultured Ruminococcus sp.]|uniref:dockerin type I repeat-containing protein n=1 Tax=uncultured Ruminococcus sp. TaxID=165186 RepID=UPI00261529E3|nr:dockerin type I repeat-containing protein [uncultured Ruminococcus sp.]